MFVSDLYISNYRSIKNIHIPFGKGKNAVVGKNNSGKSNIIKALNIILGEKSPTVHSFDEHDFHIYKDSNHTYVSEDILIAVKVANSELNKEKLKNIKYIREHRFGQNKWLKESSNDTFNLTEFFKKDIDNFQSNDFDTFKGEELIHWGRDIDEVVLYVYVKRYEDSQIEVVNGLIVKEYGYEKYLRCFPVNNRIRDAFITSAVVPAFREPGRELRINKWSWYGKLINKVWENRSDELKSKIEEMNRHLSKLSNFVFDSTSSEIESILHNLFSFDNVNFRILPKDNKELYWNVNTKLNN